MPHESVTKNTLDMIGQFYINDYDWLPRGQTPLGVEFWLWAFFWGKGVVVVMSDLLASTMSAGKAQQVNKFTFTCEFNEDFAPISARTREWWQKASKEDVNTRVAELRSLVGCAIERGPFPYMHKGEWYLLFFLDSQVGPAYRVFEHDMQSPGGTIVTLGCKIINLDSTRDVDQCGVHIFKEHPRTDGTVIRSKQADVKLLLPSKEASATVIAERASWALYNAYLGVQITNLRKGPNPMETLSAVCTAEKAIPEKAQSRKMQRRMKTTKDGQILLKWCSPSNFTPEIPVARFRFKRRKFSLGPNNKRPQKPEKPDWPEDPSLFEDMSSSFETNFLPPPVPRRVPTVKITASGAAAEDPKAQSGPTAPLDELANLKKQVTKLMKAEKYLGQQKYWHRAADKDGAKLAKTVWKNLPLIGLQQLVATLFSRMPAADQVSCVHPFRLMALQECEARRSKAMLSLQNKEKAHDEELDQEALAVLQSPWDPMHDMVKAERSATAGPTEGPSAGPTRNPALLGPIDLTHDDADEPVQVKVKTEPTTKSKLVKFVHKAHYITSNSSMTGYAGVYMDATYKGTTRTKPWRVKYKGSTLGRYETKAEACEVYAEAYNAGRQQQPDIDQLET